MRADCRKKYFPSPTIGKILYETKFYRHDLTRPTQLTTTIGIYRSKWICNKHCISIVEWKKEGVSAERIGNSTKTITHAKGLYKRTHDREGEIEKGSLWRGNHDECSGSLTWYKGNLCSNDDQSEGLWRRVSRWIGWRGCSTSVGTPIGHVEPSSCISVWVWWIFFYFSGSIFGNR